VSGFNVSRFANPNRTDVLVLGPCKCPDRRLEVKPFKGPDLRTRDRGTPHEQDEVVYRLELGAGEEERAGTYGWSVTGWQYFDSAAARAKLVEIGVVRWNLLGPDGEPMPVTVRSAALLDDETLGLITAKLDEVTARGDPLPNGSGAPSVASTPVSASRTRKTPKRR
jgi:hypothetical protein